MTFIQTPMVHWPDNMLTYLPDEKLLFSNDAFGQHIASPERFDDEYGLDILLEAAGNYYSNIVLPYGAQVKKALESAASLQIDMIAPSHGLIWRKHVSGILNLYAKWANNETDNKCVIVFDSMYGSTEKMAEAIGSAFEEKGIAPRLMNLKVCHHSEVMPEILTAKYICVGSSTLNSNMLPTVSSFLTYMKGLAPKNRVGLAFGSYGWGGQSIGQIDEILTGMGFETMKQIKLNYVPTSAQLEETKHGVLAELRQAMLD
ncbi:MAG: FprA family A-type flavoprotein, partial [Eubacteriales bacterium]|nr:FprA family A-type flavoprotein [Eubacteriales bacterium]